MNSKSPKILAIIPARGGSKGIPRKNIRLLKGKPLIEYTIEAALQANINARVVVSTEDEEIAEVSRRAGAEVPFMRPANLAQDDTSTTAVIEHVVEQLEEEGYLPDYIMLLQPTSPFRDEQDIEKAMNIIIENKCNGVVGVSEVKEHPFLIFSIGEENQLIPYADNPENLTRRQDFPAVYRINGAIYIVTRDAWHQYHSFVHLPGIFPYMMSSEKALDIDEEIDWKMAEFYAEKSFL